MYLIKRLSYLDIIKLIMMTAMTLGHIAWLFVPTESVAGQLMHFVGRITIPLACFLVVQGFVLTHNLTGYIQRMFGFGLLAQVPFIMTWVGVYRLLYEPSLVLAGFNVLFTLGFGLLALCCVRQMANSSWLYKVMYVLLIAMLSCLAYWADWGVAVIVWILAIYYGRVAGFVLASVMMFVVALCVPEGSVWRFVNPNQLMDYGVFLGVPVMWAYERLKKHSQTSYSQTSYRLPRTFFYWYYVLHLLALGLLGQYSSLALDTHQVRCHMLDCADRQ